MKKKLMRIPGQITLSDDAPISDAPLLSSGTTGLNLYSMLVAVAGSVIVLLIYNAVRKPARRSMSGSKLKRLRSVLRDSMFCRLCTPPESCRKRDSDTLGVRMQVFFAALSSAPRPRHWLSGELLACATATAAWRYPLPAALHCMI